MNTFSLFVPSCRPGNMPVLHALNFQTTIYTSDIIILHKSRRPRELTSNRRGFSPDRQRHLVMVALVISPNGGHQGFALSTSLIFPFSFIATHPPTTSHPTRLAWAAISSPLVPSPRDCDSFDLPSHGNITVSRKTQLCATEINKSVFYLVVFSTTCSIHFFPYTLSQMWNNKDKGFSSL